jgi:protein-tyrosine phosphatase
MDVLRRGRGLVFHCTAGKDRTGVIAALLLNLCGVSVEDIITDDAFTYELMRPFFDTMVENARKAGIVISGHLFRSDPAFMREFLDYLRGTYGGAEPSLLGQGLSARDLEGLRDRLLA